MSGASRTVTFLFTDVEGSTRRWEERPADMAESLASHDALVRQAIEGNAGRIFKRWGDQFCAAFDSPSSALCAALQVQLELQGNRGTGGQAEADPTPNAQRPTPLRVRVAIHSGAAEERDGDFFGPPLNRVARMLAAANGGQVLLSAAAAALTRGSLPPEAGLLELGLFRLKDLPEPEPIFQLTHPALPNEFKPLATDSGAPNNLPRQLSTFIGREKELAKVKQLLAGTCLLTLTGPGGSGKTRLAIQAASELLEEFPDGVRLVELAAITDPSLAPRAVAAACLVREEPGRPVEESLVEALHSKRMLIVLDNCEHMLDGCAHLADRLLVECPRLKVLATGREALGITGELRFPVPTLTMPDPDRAGSPAALQRYEAVKLFVERAKAANPSFTLTTANAPAVAKICRELDGIPLALELAAAKARVLTPEQLAARLKERFQMLKGGSRVAPERQQTLLAAVAWSYDLLTAAEKKLFRRLSVFAGGWTVNAAYEVCADEDQDDLEVLELLTRLVDKSLVVADEVVAGELRHRYLETIRDYAATRLEQSGEQEAIRDRHRAYFLGLAEEAAPHLQDADQQLWFDRLSAEHPNLRAAWSWMQDSEERLRLATALCRLWMVRGPLAEGRSWLEGALVRANGVEPRVAGRALNAAGTLAWIAGDYSTASERYEESLSLFRRLGDEGQVARQLNNLGLIAVASHNLAAARGFFEESLAVFRSLNETRHVGMVLGNLGDFLLSVGEFDRSADVLTESLAILRSCLDSNHVASVLSSLGYARLGQGLEDQAAHALEESLALYRTMSNVAGAATAVLGISAIAAAEGQFDRSTRLLGAVTELVERSGGSLPPFETAEYARWTAECRLQLGEDYDALAAEGRLQTDEMLGFGVAQAPE